MIEIVSPSDRVGELAEKIQDYIQLGIPNIWVVNPRLRRIAVQRRG